MDYSLLIQRQKKPAVVTVVFASPVTQAAGIPATKAWDKTAYGLG
jgi:hypothetical protein